MALKRLHNNGVWSPSETELKVAEYLACGYSQNRTAQLCDMTQQTISNWLKRPEFEAFVAERTVQFLNSQDAVHYQTLALAKLLVHQALAGERADDDPQVKLALRVLAETEYPQRRGEPRLQFGKHAEDA